MKKAILTGMAFGALVAPAMSADLYVKAPPPVVHAYNWTGCYVGGNVGYGYADNNQFVSNETFNGAPFVSGTWPGAGNFGTPNPSGAFGGGQVGCNYQTGAFVFGAETDLQASGIRGSAAATLPYISTPNTITEGLSSNLDWFGTFRGRIGYAVWDRLLIFATGGLAYGEVKNTYTYTDTLGFTGATSASSTRSGYTVGAGVEWAFANNWSAKFEYQYIDFGSRTLGLTEFVGGAPSAFADATSVKDAYQTFRVGLNYKFW